MADTKRMGDTAEPNHSGDVIGAAEHSENEPHRVDTSLHDKHDGVFEKGPNMEKVDEFGAHDKTDPREIALVKRLDWYMLPMLWLMYLFNHLDRHALVNARLNDLEEDLGLVGTQYNTCMSILFVGYICGQVPANMVINRVRPSLFMAGFCMSWSIVSLLTYLAHDFGSLLALRFMLGLTEAPFYPGALYLLSVFYTRKEVATRMSIFYSANMLASAFSGLIAAGIFAGLDGSLGLKGWQWLYIVQGAASIAVALLAFWFLPDTPLTTRWLNEEQRQLAHSRIVLDTTDRREGTSVWIGLKEACVDWRLWVFCAMYNFHLSSTSFQYFLPTVMQTLGYTRTVTLALTCPPYLLAAAMAVVVAWNSGKYNERTWHITSFKALVCIGFIIPAVTFNVPARMVAIFLFTGFSYGINNIILGWLSSTLGQTNEKRSVSIAICNTLGNLASVYTPYLWPSSHGPRYLPAWMASIGYSAAVILLAWVMKMVLMRKNQKMRRHDPDTLNFYVY